MKNPKYDSGKVSIISPKEFIRKYENNPGEIKESIILPPELGRPGFGMIIVNSDYDTLSLRKKMLLKHLKK